MSDLNSQKLARIDDAARGGQSESSLEQASPHSESSHAYLNPL